MDVHVSGKCKRGEYSRFNVNQHIFLREEDIKITDAVKRYNNTCPTDPKFEENRSFVFERTKLLLYYLPIKNYYLSDELCGEFYMMMLPKLENIISSFKISGDSFIAYLSQLCKLRALTFTASKSKELQTELDLWINESTVSYSYSADLELSSSSKMKMEKYRSYDIEQILYLIISQIPEKRSIANKTKAEMVKYLNREINRKGFLLYCLFNVKNLSAKLQEQLSFLYGVDVELFSCLSEKLHELQVKKYRKREEELGVINKHWKRMLVLKNALVTEEDSFKRKEMTYLYNLSKNSKNTRIKELNSHLPGLSYADLSEIFNLPKGTVASAIFRVRKKLEEISSGGIESDDGQIIRAIIG